MIQKATPETILKLHDQLSNELPQIKGKWGFSFKVFRNNPYSIDISKGDDATLQQARFLHVFKPTYLKDACVCLIDKKTSATLLGRVLEDSDESIGREVPVIAGSHLHKGATSGLNDPFDFFVAQKLQSLWVQRQSIRGDGGQIYELENGNLTIRTSNVFLHGIFKGLLIQIEVQNKESKLDREEVLKKVTSKYNIPLGKIYCNVLDASSPDYNSDLCLQYSEVLNF